MHVRQILAGVTGISIVALPLAGSASSIAFMIAAREQVVPDSPAPLALAATSSWRAVRARKLQIGTEANRLVNEARFYYRLGLRL
jgi:hypothetical protein